MPAADLSNNPLGFDALKLMFRIYFELIGFRMFGTEHLPKTGGFILAANHITNMDPFAVGQGTGRRVHFMAKKELFRSRLGHWFQTTGNAFPVDRSKADLTAIKTTLRLLQAGQIVVIFPQGTRGGEVARGGVGFFALKANVPIVPAGLRLVRSRLGLLKGYQVHYGPAIPPEGSSEELTARAMAAISALADED